MLTEVIIRMLAAFATAYAFVVILQGDLIIKKRLQMKQHERLKPLDCVPCLSFWVAICYAFLPIEIVALLLSCFGAAFIGNKIS